MCTVIVNLLHNNKLYRPVSGYWQEYLYIIKDWEYAMRREMQEIVPNLYLGPYATANKNKVLHFVKTWNFVLGCVFMGVLLFFIIKTTKILRKLYTHIKWKVNKSKIGIHFFHFLPICYMCVFLVEKCFYFLVRLFRVNRNNWYHLCQTYCRSKFHQTQFSREDQVGFLSTYQKII